MLNARMWLINMIIGYVIRVIIRKHRYSLDFVFVKFDKKLKIKSIILQSAHSVAMVELTS